MVGLRMTIFTLLGLLTAYVILLHHDVNAEAETCKSTEWQCEDGICIPASYRCDREKDCHDFSDEKNCSQGECPDPKGYDFQCDNGTCVPGYKVCDGNDNCGDMSDEKDCREKRDCYPQYELQCDKQVCLLKTKVCDGSDDCESDERDCDDMTNCYFCYYNATENSDNSANPYYDELHTASCKMPDSNVVQTIKCPSKVGCFVVSHSNNDTVEYIGRGCNDFPIDVDVKPNSCVKTKTNDSLAEYSSSSYCRCTRDLCDAAGAAPTGMIRASLPFSLAAVLAIAFTTHQL